MVSSRKNISTVGVGEREFLYAPKDSDVVCWLLDNDDESWPLLKRQGCYCAHPFRTWGAVVLLQVEDGRVFHQGVFLAFLVAHFRECCGGLL